MRRQCEPGKVMTCDLTNQMIHSVHTEDRYVANYCWLWKPHTSGFDSPWAEKGLGKWPTDKCWTNTLEKQVHHYRWFANVDLARTLNFAPSSDPLVQILNTFNSHLICVSTFGCKPNSVKMYAVTMYAVTAWGQVLCRFLPRSVSPHSWIVRPD